MSDPATPPQRPASALLFEELRREQRAFRGVMTAMAAILLLAATIAAGGAAFSYFELQRLRTEYAEQLALSEANLKVLAGEAARQRETNNARFVALRQERDSANRHLDIKQRVEDAADLRPFRADAVAFAQAHVLGDPLDSSTAEVVTRVLDAAREDGGLISEAERLLLAAVRADWLLDDEEALAGFQALYEGEHPPQWRAYGAAGLAAHAYRRADNDSLVWDQGCSDAVAYADEAIALGLDAAALSVWQGNCLRKAGETLRAYEAFRAAREALARAAAAGREVNTDLRMRAVHGEGTTLIALVAHGDTPEGLGDDPLAHALALLQSAADLRRQLGATEVGLAYTNENIGFIHAIRRDWDKALAHTAEIDRVLPMAWNLTVRHISAVEKAKALAAADAPESEIERMYAIADEAERVLSLMRYGQFDEPELLRLLPERYTDTVSRLAAPAKQRARSVSASDPTEAS